LLTAGILGAFVVFISFHINKADLLIKKKKKGHGHMEYAYTTAGCFMLPQHDVYKRWITGMCDY